MNNVRVRLPRKLVKSVSNGVLAEAGRLNPVGALGITLNMLPVHRVTMTLAENDLPLAMHDLVEVYNHKGSVGIYRVTKIPHTIGKNRKYEFSHGLDVLSDATFDMIEEYKGTVAGMLAKIIDAQTQKIGGVKYWQLGTCADPNPWNKDIKYDNLMDCLTEIARKEEDYMFTFDQSTFPWTLNFVARDNDVLSEFRLNRNTEKCVITEDDADLCTRLYLSVTSETNDDEGNGTYIDEGYFTYNDTTAQSDFGVVCKTAGVNQEDFASQAALEAWVAAYFGRHNKPGVQITIDGVELNKLTGESIDEVHLARICRVALPEYSCTFNERIVSVNYPDALRKPTYVRNSLANKRQTAEDAFSEIKKTANKASKSAGGAGRAAHNDATYFRRTIGDTANGLYSRIEQTAYYIRAEVVDVANGLYSRIEETASYIRAEVADTANGLNSKIEQTASYIRSEVSDTANGLYSKIEETASYIRSEVSDTANGLNSKIDQTASYIRSEVSDTANGLYSRIEQTASSWSAKVSGVVDSNGNVTAASIALAINNGGSTATINASQIYLLGNTIADQITADYIATKIATLSSLSVSSIACSGTIGANEIQVGTLKFRSSSGSGYSYSDLKSLFVTSVEVSGPTNNVYTLKYHTADGTEKSGGTFSRATTLSGTWSGGIFTVNASPQESTTNTGIMDVPNADVTWNGNVASFPVKANRDGGEVVYNTGKTLTINASGRDAASGVAAGRHGSGYSWDFTITRGDDTTKTLTIDCSAIYSDARAGYTQGTFTLQTITLQGTQTSSLTLQGSAATTEQVVLQGTQTASLTLQGESQTVYEEVNSGGTLYYTAGTAATYYNAGTTTKYARGDSVTVTLQGSQTASLTLQGSSQTVFEEVSSGGTVYYTAGTAVTRYKGNGSSVTGRGTSVSVKPCGNAVRFKRHTSGTPSGTWYTIDGSNYDLTYYVGGSDTTYYQGNGSSVTGRGDSESITPIGSTSKRLSSVTRYKAGTNVGKLYNAGEIATYYKGNGGSFTVQGTSVSVTPIGSTSKRLSSVTRYKAGTNVGKLYNAGTIATVYPATETLYKAGSNIGKLYNAGTIDSTHYYTKS